jgi:hypothetical protein
MSELVRYDAMCSAIAECHSVDEVAELHNKARALEIYAKQAQNVEAERKATEIRLRAERKAGELYGQMHRTPPQAASPNGRAGKESPATAAGDSTKRSEYREALDRTGVSERTAQRWQGLAAVPAETFEQHLADPETKPTTNGILRAANGAKRMDEGSLWLWGHLRDFERDSRMERAPAEMFEGMTETMQADVRRILPTLLDWLTDLEHAAT